MNSEGVKEEIIKKGFNYKLYFWALILVIVAAISFYIIESNKERKIEEKRRLELANYEASRRALVQDSLAKMQAAKEIFDRQQAIVRRRDSAFKTLRFRTGDIVYLKPDSVRGVITNITVDSLMYYYNYFIIISNKNGDPIICERTDKLIY